MELNKTIYQVDSFTQEPFKGNPAAIMFVDDGVSTQWMQNMAMEMNLSETAFIKRESDCFAISFFTPTKEVNLCGHATLAAAHIIFQLGLKLSDEKIIFKTKTDTLTIRKENDFLVMDFPLYPVHEIHVMKSFEELVGFVPVKMYESTDNWIIALAASQEDIENAQPQFGLLSKYGLGELIVTAPASNTELSDFVVRVFAPDSGINEDPVTGSAHCALASLWHLLTGKTDFISRQISARTGEMRIKIKDSRIEIWGKAVTIFEAKINYTKPYNL